MTKTRLVLPQMSEDMTEGTIGRWNKKPGDTVREGESLVELELDKVTVEVPAPASGVLLEVIAKESETLPVGALLGILVDAAEAPPPAPKADADVAPAAPAAQRVAAERPVPPPRSTAHGKYRVVVVGGGTTGLTVATRLAQLGQQVDLVERNEWLGGDDVDGGMTARHVVLAASVQWRAEVGSAGPPRPTTATWIAMTARARKEETRMRTAHELLRKARNNITRHRGTGRVRPLLVEKRSVDPAGTLAFHGEKNPVVDVLDDTGSVTTTFEPDHVVVATGAEPSVTHGLHVDGERVLAPRDVLALPEVPWRLVVLAGDGAGLEWAMAFSELGTAVTLVDSRPRLFPALDEDLEHLVRKWIERRGVRILLAAKSVGTSATATGIAVHLALGDGADETDVVESDRMLCAMARRTPVFHHVPNDRRVHVVRPRVLPAVSPSRAVVDAIELAENIARVSVAPLPRPQPELVHLGRIDVAWVGASEADLVRDGIPHRVGKAPFVANPAARASGTSDGHAKLLVHAKSDRILGAQIWGPSADALIGEVALAISLGASGDELARTPRPPGSRAEVLSEAARSAAGWPLMLAR